MTPATGKYVQFSCEACGNVFNSKPDLMGGVVDQVKSSLFGSIPLVGGLLAGASQTQLDPNAAFNEVRDQFRECAGCSKIVCLSCFDARQNKCSHCRMESVAKEVSANASQAAAGAAAAFGAGLGAMAAGMAALGGAGAQIMQVTCPSCQKATLRAPACQHCGRQLPESVLQVKNCAKCGAPNMGAAKFCPGCGAPAS